MDIAIGAFWILDTRLQQTAFLPALAQDKFFLVLKDEEKAETLAEVLGKPFRPFSWGLWGLIGANLFMISVILVISAGEEEGG